MKIILRQEVNRLGFPGDVVTVRDGYARNYLIPMGFAEPVTKGALPGPRAPEAARGAA